MSGIQNVLLSDYFFKIYTIGALMTHKQGKAYVDSQTSEEFASPKKGSYRSRDSLPFQGIVLAEREP